MIKISVIIPTYNPNKARLIQTLKGLESQDFPFAEWELIIVDNKSTNSFSKGLNLDWHPNTRIVIETKEGLTFARIRGFKECKANIIIMVDDDNILAKDYLTETFKIFTQNPMMGAIGGQSIPLFESKPPEWISQFYTCLAVRNLGERVIREKWEIKYPAAAPIGAGMAIRKISLTKYIEKIQSGNNIITDRLGNSLSSGGDNDIVLEIIKSGWEVGYFPQLSLKHIIPPERIQSSYLARLNKDSSKSWIHLLNSHGINPWKRINKFTVIPRQIKAFFTFKAWQNAPNYIKWKGACGSFKALGEID